MVGLDAGDGALGYATEGVGLPVDVGHCGWEAGGRRIGDDLVG